MGKLKITYSAVIVLLMCLGSSVFSAELRINEIEVTGNVTLEPEEIFSKIKLRRNDILAEQTLADDVKNIAELDGVEYAYYNLDEVEGGVNLTYVVVEREVIRDIIINGNKKYRDKKLIKETGLKKGEYLDRAEVGIAVDMLKNFYIKKGFPFVEISLDELKLNNAVIEINIDEGSKKIKTYKVYVQGNEKLSDKYLLDRLESKKKAFFFFKKTFNKEYPQQDIEAIIEKCRNKGFLDAEVTSKVSFEPKEGRADITFIVNEGTQYIVSDVAVSGNSVFSNEELLSEMKLREDEPFGSDKEKHDTRSLLDKYREIGYIEADVTLTKEFHQGNMVACRYDIVENDRYRVGRITITGNENVHDKAVRNVLDDYGFKPGEWYDGSLASGDGTGTLENDLKRAVYAESAVITPVESDAGTKNAIVDITEGQTGMIMFGAGVNSSSGVIGQVILEQRNFDLFDWPDSMSEFLTGKAFRGAGQRLRLTFEPGTEETRYSATWTDPYLNDMPYELTVGSSSFERDWEAHTEKRLSGRFSLARRYDDGWTFGTGFRAENVKTEDIDFDAPWQIFDEEGNNNIYGVQVFVTRDTTDSRYTPTEGDIFQTSLEGLAGDYDFGKLEFTYRFYHPLWEDISGRKTVLASKLHYGSVIGDAPTFEKYYAGGTGNLRGFEYRGVSPRGESKNIPGRKKDPVGSDWIFLANTEMSIPLSSDMFSWLLFIDSGTVETGRYRSAAGTGIEIMIPQWFGPVPMRFEFGIPITEDDTDDTQVFSFSVGRLF
ncbi:Outer membrane protein Omp85 [Limihaloglobus sulfuriphilus]|uniref:Outer membrane protein assembly factor BamA n=2 Tax=Limihaloglobus sulfuriphilus TaxID=1851148 RepID=A0A1Q2MBP2_9BACT|nr:Outer membrane protein Omp85 [Limihaloglobus sulfuriphilus]